MDNSIIPGSVDNSPFDSIAKELRVDEEGKGFVSLRGLARLCGVRVGNWGKGDSKFTLVIDGYLAQSGFKVSEMKHGSSIPDLIAAEVIGYYAEEQQNPVAKKSSRAFRAIGLRTLIRQATGYKENLKRKLTAEEIIELCCLPVPTSWQRRFPEEYYEHLSRLTGLIVEGTTRPGYWAALTKEIVYDYLPTGIYAEIKRCKHESGSWEKLHQYLSPEGVEVLEAHQRKVLHHLQGAANLEQLRVSLKQACTGQYQLVLL